MPGEVVNLNRFRKERARREKEAKASANRRRFGRTKDERASDDVERDRREAELDGAVLESSDETASITSDGGDDDPPKAG